MTAIPHAGPQCPRCGDPLAAPPQARSTNCPRCWLAFEAVAFDPPALRPSLPGAVPDAGTACAVHELNAAVAACERCGAFACELCRVTAEGKSLCASCFGRLAAEGALSSMARRRFDYEGTSWSFVIMSLLLVPGFVFTPFLAVGGIVLAVVGLRRLRKDGETDRLGSLWGALAACLAALALQAAFWVLVVSDH